MSEPALKEITGRIGKYDIVKPLGKGAMGIVYLAKDSMLDREVALKVVRADVALSAGASARFVAEARATAALAHPGIVAFEKARHVRIWKLDARTGAFGAQFLYPLDDPATFLRDQKAGSVELSDVKVSEIAVIGPDRLLILERISRITKIYQVTLSARFTVPAAHMDVRTLPTLEQSSAALVMPEDLPVLAKSLVLTTDDAPEMDRDLEGLVVLSPKELLLVTDNDFSVEDARTRFWRVRLAAPLA